MREAKLKGQPQPKFYDNRSIRAPRSILDRTLALRGTTAVFGRHHGGSRLSSYQATKGARGAFDFIALVFIGGQRMPLDVNPAVPWCFGRGRE